MPKESTNLKLKLYNAVTDAKELAVDWFNNVFDYTNSNWAKIDDAYKEIKDKFDDYPTKDGTGATGDWGINITGESNSAKKATNDSTGQQIDSTYVKDVKSTDDGKLVVTKGNGNTSTADVSTPAGYTLVKTVQVPFKTTTDEDPQDYWLHIGDIKNTADNDVVKIKLSYSMFVQFDNGNTDAAISEGISHEASIIDLAQKTESDLSSTYGIFTIYSGGATVKSVPKTLAAENEPTESTDEGIFAIIPTAGGNKTSCGSVWMYFDANFTESDNASENLSFSVEVADKNQWEYVLEWQSTEPTSDAIISSDDSNFIITNTDFATNSNVGVVKIGDNINVSDGGIISVPVATTAQPGVVKVGTGLNVATDGTISSDVTIDTATTTTKGIVSVGDNINVVDGKISINNYAGSSTPGGTANSVNSFTFKAQTSDPGAGSSLATGTILFVYS